MLAFVAEFIEPLPELLSGRRFASVFVPKYNFCAVTAPVAGAQVKSVDTTTFEDLGIGSRALGMVASG
jgi:hypothetical protein